MFSLSLHLQPMNGRHCSQRHVQHVSAEVVGPERNKHDYFGHRPAYEGCQATEIEFRPPKQIEVILKNVQ